MGLPGSLQVVAIPEQLWTGSLPSAGLGRALGCGQQGRSQQQPCTCRWISRARNSAWGRNVSANEGCVCDGEQPTGP